MGNGLPSPQVQSQLWQSQVRAKPQNSSSAGQDGPQASTRIANAVKPCHTEHQSFLSGHSVTSNCSLHGKALHAASSALPQTLSSHLTCGVPGLHSREASALDVVLAFHPGGQLQPLMPYAVASERERGTNETGRTQGLQRPLDPERK